MGESPFYLYHGRDLYLPKLQDLLGYKIRYMGNDKNGLMIDSLHVLYQETAAHLMHSRQNMNTDIPTFKGEMFSVGDMVLLKDHQKGKLLLQFSQTYRVLRKIVDKMVDLIDLQGVVR